MIREHRRQRPVRSARPWLSVGELRTALALASGLAWAVFMAGLWHEARRDWDRRQRDAVALRLLRQVFPRGLPL